MELLLKAAERLFARLPRVKIRHEPHGLELSSPYPFGSEFLPGHQFTFGICLRPGYHPARAWDAASFLISFDGSGHGLPELARFSLWTKSLSARPSSSLRLERVEDVPQINAYRSIGADESLAAGSLDALTEWHLALSRQGLEGRLRLTDLDHGSYLLTQASSLHLAPAYLWAAAESYLAGKEAKRLHLLLPDGDESPVGYGFTKEFSFQVFGSLDSRAL